MKTRLAAVLFGVTFGVLLSWGRLTDPEVIRRMLLLRELDVFFLMGSAMAVGFVGVRILRALKVRSLLGGEQISWTPTPVKRTHVTGSVLFGLGWSIACTCPGPVAAQLGNGQFAALFTMGGMLVGIALRGWIAAKSTASTKVQSEAAVVGL